MYKWTDSWPILFTKWGSGEPVDGPNRGCVAMTASGEWNNTICDTPRAYICKTTTGMPKIFLICLTNVCEEGTKMHVVSSQRSSLGASRFILLI